MAQISLFRRSRSTGIAVLSRLRAAGPGEAIPLLWPVFVLCWPVFVIAAGPAVAAFGAGTSATGTVAALAWTVAFLASYLWLCLFQPFRIPPTATVTRARFALLALLAGLVVTIVLVAPPGNFWIFICVLVAAGTALPPRAAVTAIVAVTALAVAIEGFRGGWATAPQALGIFVWGIAAILLRQLVLAIDELTVAREERARLAVAEERMRFARDLHDLLGQSLSLITLKSQLAGRLLHIPGGDASAEIVAIEETARRALREVRDAVAGYRSPTLDREIACSREILRTAGIACHVHRSTGPLPQAVDAVLAWAVREGVTNVIRHSGARQCRIDLRRAGGTVRLRVLDDGRGAAFVRLRVGGGSGLCGITERLTAIDGQVHMGQRARGGFALQVTVPLESRRSGAPAAAREMVTA